jgi:ethanolamine ammonia-lyase small subunit
MTTLYEVQLASQDGKSFTAIEVHAEDLTEAMAEARKQAPGHPNVRGYKVLEGDEEEHPAQ